MKRRLSKRLSVGEPCAGAAICGVWEHSMPRVVLLPSTVLVPFTSAPGTGDTAGCWVLSKGWLWKRPRGAAAGDLPAPASGPAEPEPCICKYMIDYFYYFHCSLFNSPLFCSYLSQVLRWCSGIKGAPDFALILWSLCCDWCGGGTDGPRQGTA